MATRGCISTRPDSGRVLSGREVVELVDALVEAVDLDRWQEIERLRSALDALGVVEVFDAELRLNGVASAGEWCPCWEMEL